MRRRHPYRRIDHPAVGAVPCPYCHAVRGNPCKKFHDFLGWRYTETHEARIKKYEQMGREVSSEKVL